MDARYTIRKAQLLEECQVAPEVFEQVMPRLRAFLAPFVDTLQGQAPRAHAQTYVRGLLSDVERKNVESIAYHFGQDRLGLQGFIGWDDWDDAPLRHTLRSQVGQQLGQADGVLVFDPSAFPKSGRAWAVAQGVRRVCSWGTHLVCSACVTGMPPCFLPPPRCDHATQLVPSARSRGGTVRRRSRRLRAPFVFRFQHPHEMQEAEMGANGHTRYHTRQDVVHPADEGRPRASFLQGEGRHDHRTRPDGLPDVAFFSAQCRGK